MTYLVLDVIFVGVAGMVLLVARRVAAVDGRGTSRAMTQRSHAAEPITRRRTRPSGVAIAWTILGLAIMTAIFDNLMIAAGLFEFADEHLVGLFVGRAPVEDVGYPLAAALLLPAVWHLLGARGTTRADASGGATNGGATTGGASTGGTATGGATTGGTATDRPAQTPERAS